MPKSAKKSASKVDSTLAAVAKPTKATKNGKRDADEIVEKKVASGKKQKIVNGGAAPAVEKKKVETKTKKKKNKKQESSSSESEEEEKKEEPIKTGDESDSDDGDSSDEEDTKAASDEEPAKQEAAKEANSDSEEESEEGEDNSSEEEDEAKTTKKNAQTPATPQATGPKTLFIGNLSFSVEESDVINFFKDAGEVAEVRFSMKDGRFAGYGHVEFATPDAAQKALKLNGELFFERAVRLDLAKERGAYTPSEGNDRSSQKSGQSQGLTVFVRGFGTDDGFDIVKSTLEEHFGQCGEISRMSIPKDFESGGPKGVAFIDFTDSKALNKALELTGSEVSGGTITVEEAKQKGGGGGGRGRGGRSGGRGRFGGRDGGRGRFGGRDGGRGRFGGRDGGRGRGRGGRGRGF
ncbi:hypothetical protein L1987_17042 [Smallanthus sonchifolius]|uniref:Uncharacterized protein n=1 Tax=Smallanthus sonchifolius TaxID=185202 RepID=A0ACB9IXT7_9ASTR|nr:hypothetical protein L1987_17042 [Smallanthus sonchifolius]